MPDVTIIIPNINGKPFLEECFGSLLDQDVDIKVIVIDNASTDGSADWIISNYPEFTVINNQKNMGFAFAVNQGIKNIEYRLYSTFKQRCGLAKNCITSLLQCIKEDENYFCSSIKMIDYHDKNPS